MPCKPSTPTWMLLIWAIMATSGFVQSQTPELEPVRFEDFFHNCSGNCRRGNCSNCRGAIAGAIHTSIAGAIRTCIVPIPVFW